MIRNVYPAWMDVASCGNSGYDLPAGKSTKSGTVTVKYDGVLLGVGGHLHDYGQQVVLQIHRAKKPWRRWTPKRMPRAVSNLCP